MERPRFDFSPLPLFASPAFRCRPKSLNSGRCPESEDLEGFRHYSVSLPCRSNCPQRKWSLLRLGPADPRPGITLLRSYSPPVCLGYAPACSHFFTLCFQRHLQFHTPCASDRQAESQGGSRGDFGVAFTSAPECYCEQEPPPKKAKLAQKLSQATLSGFRLQATICRNGQFDS